MLIIHERPPNWEKIIAVFPWVEKREGVFYSWSDRIYNPSGVRIKAILQHHEEAHAARHNGDSAGWWDSYLSDLSFRFEEELVAHQAEYRFFAKRHYDPAKRYNYLNLIAKRLSGELYGGMCTPAQALTKIIQIPKRNVSQEHRA